MNTFKKLQVKDFPIPDVKKESIEQSYWKEFQFPTVVKEFSAINYVDISPVKPYNSLVTSSGKVQIFDKQTNAVIRQSSRSKENVYGARYRHDGKLMVTGGDSGLVQILDVKTRAILRSLRGHTSATRVCSFGKEQTKVFSASDDKTVRQWDIPTEKEIKSNKAANDFIRCGCIYPKNTDQFITGSYDHMVKLWDFRSSENQEVLLLDHESPVESVVVHSGGGICVSAGSNYIKVWDIAAGGRMLFQFSNHQKTVSTLCFDGDETRLLSGSLDRNVKVYNVLDYSVVATLNYPSPILAMGLSKDDSYLVIGMSDGAISLQNRAQTKGTSSNAPLRAKNTGYQFEKRLEKCEIRQPELKTKALKGTKEYLTKKAEISMPNKGDVVVKDTRRIATRFNKVDNFLRRFQYREAFEVSLNGKDEMIISLIIELDRRDALEIALKQQTTRTLNTFLDFLSRNISNSMYTKILQPVAGLLLDIYTPLMFEDPVFLTRLQKLNKKLKDDLSACQEMMKLLGVIEQVYTLSTPPPKPDEERRLKFLASDNGNGEGKEEKMETEDSEKLTNETDQETLDNDVDFEIKETNTEILIVEDDSS